MIRLEPQRPSKALSERSEDVGEVAAEIREAALEPEVKDDVDQRLAQAMLPRIVRAIRRRIGVDVLGRDRGPHEKTTVVEIGAVKDLARYRVEESFRALGLLVVDQEADVLALDFGPGRVIDAAAAEVELEAGNGFRDAAIVEVDPVAGDVADRKPIACFKIAFCEPRAVAEQLVMAIEPVEGRLGDGLRARGGARRVNSSRPRPEP
jgi:hypothetical protein